MSHKTNAEYGLVEYQADQGRIIISAPPFDDDSFLEMGEILVRALSAQVLEKQWDADLHSWLIDFEGCQLFLKAEYYSESLWLEVLAKEGHRDELDYLARLFRRGFTAY